MFREESIGKQVLKQLDKILIMRPLLFYVLVILFGNPLMWSSCTGQTFPKPDSTKIYPSDILPGLNKWYITLPVDANGNTSAGATNVDNRNTNPLLIKGNALINYEYLPYFDVIDSAVVFRAPCDGATTTGSKYPRCELRELVGGGTNYWSVNDFQFLQAELKVTHLPEVKPDVCFTQIHAPGHNEPLRMHYNATKGLYFVANTTNHYYIKDEVPYSLGQTLLVKVAVQNGTITCFIKNLANGKQTVRTWKSDQPTGYFKIGCYTQSSIFLSQFKKEYSEDEPMDAYGEVRVLSLNIDETY